MAAASNGNDSLPAMAVASRARVEVARAALDETELRARALASAVPPQLPLSARRFDLIAEVKFRSPTSGQLREGSESSVLARVAGYAEAGSAARSRLAEAQPLHRSRPPPQIPTSPPARPPPAIRHGILVCSQLISR